MTPEQALSILVTAAQYAPLPFAAHVQCGEASKVLHDAIKPQIAKVAT